METETADSLLCCKYTCIGVENGDDINRVRTGHGNPGKSWNFYSGIFQDWKVLEN